MLSRNVKHAIPPVSLATVQQSLTVFLATRLIRFMMVQRVLLVQQKNMALQDLQQLATTATHPAKCALALLITTAFPAMQGFIS